LNLIDDADDCVVIDAVNHQALLASLLAIQLAARRACRAAPRRERGAS